MQSKNSTLRPVRALSNILGLQQYRLKAGIPQYVLYGRSFIFAVSFALVAVVAATSAIAPRVQLQKSDAFVCSFGERRASLQRARLTRPDPT